MIPGRLILAAMLLFLTAQADARDRIRIVGSSAVLGFAQPVAEQFARHWNNLAAEVAPQGTLTRNTAERWSDVDPTLPGTEILIMAPEPNTSAAIAFRELVLVEGCRAHPVIKGLDDVERERVCRSLRHDDRVINAAKREDEVVAWLENNQNGCAIVNYTTYKDFADRIAVNPIETVIPTEETIGSNRYPLVAGMYVYVKNRHALQTPGLQQFLFELTSERALALDGYLIEQGLVSLDDMGRNRARDKALKLGL